MLRPPPRPTLFPYTTLFRSLTRTTAPLAISHLAQFPAITLSFNLAPGEALGDAVEAVKAIEKSDRKSTRLNSSHSSISYAVFCLKKKNTHHTGRPIA